MKLSEIPSDIHSKIIPHYHITTIWIFGSAVRDDFSDESDIDMVVEFEPDAPITLLTLASLQSELEKSFGRKVDLITRKAIDDFMNPILKQEVLSSMVKMYGT
ncbi:nucleotidyltransferase family protein [Methanospirillum stamsii]|uniref:protein adenylyltransferase n=1 Tax=Methanospirillum stamsii TaxID=1277351 RepID=A0A2V2N9K6_9EURY|nr:nucleotidyltransferase family protein [Methanospirillum stamsii]PWR73158.1 nucleotidyltransferase [Methanospirillum stamsii]